MMAEVDGNLCVTSSEKHTVVQRLSEHGTFNLKANYSSSLLKARLKHKMKLKCV